MKGKSNWLLILLSAVAFIAGLVCIALGVQSYVAIICFTVESLLLLGLCMGLLPKEGEEEDRESDKKDRIRLEQENLEMSERIAAMEKEITESQQEYKNFRNTAEAEKKTLMARYDELKDRQPQAPSPRKLAEEFLPPIEESEKDNTTIDIIKIAQETIEELSGFAKKAGINILTSTADETLLVKGSVSRMRIMFRNIIDNSIKYMNRSGNLIITISNIGEDIFIVLKDNGEGLPESETKHIFELNFQGSNRISGNGLGLTQAKAIVDYYGGTIYAKSNTGRGMGIYIQLPTT